MAKNGLVAPAASNLLKPSSTAFRNLQAEWYSKVAAAEAKKLPEDAWNDIEWQPDPNSPHLKRAASKARRLTPGKEFYYAMCRNYLTHGGLKGQQLLAWSLHTDGLSFRRILKQHRKKYRHQRSIYWMFYFIDKIKKRMYQWNSTSPEGLRDDGRDGFASDVLLKDFGLAIAQPYELNRPKED